MMKANSTLKTLQKCGWFLLPCLRSLCPQRRWTWWWTTRSVSTRSKKVNTTRTCAFLKNERCKMTTQLTRGSLMIKSTFCLPVNTTKSKKTKMRRRMNKLRWSTCHEMNHSINRGLNSLNRRRGLRFSNPVSKNERIWSTSPTTWKRNWTCQVIWAQTM